VTGKAPSDEERALRVSQREYAGRDGSSDLPVEKLRTDASGRIEFSNLREIGKETQAFFPRLERGAA